MVSTRRTLGHRTGTRRGLYKIQKERERRQRMRPQYVYENDEDDYTDCSEDEETVLSERECLRLIDQIDRMIESLRPPTQNRPQKQ
jgi:hypothetical protein